MRFNILVIAYFFIVSSVDSDRRSQKSEKLIKRTDVFHYNGQGDDSANNGIMDGRKREDKRIGIFRVTGQGDDSANNGIMDGRKREEKRIGIFRVTGQGDDSANNGIMDGRKREEKRIGIFRVTGQGDDSANNGIMDGRKREDKRIGIFRVTGQGDDSANNGIMDGRKREDKRIGIFRVTGQGDDSANNGIMDGRKREEKRIGIFRVTGQGDDSANNGIMSGREFEWYTKRIGIYFIHGNDPSLQTLQQLSHTLQLHSWKPWEEPLRLKTNCSRLVLGGGGVCEGYLINWYIYSLCYIINRKKSLLFFFVLNLWYPLVFSGFFHVKGQKRRNALRISGLYGIYEKKADV